MKKLIAIFLILVCFSVKANISAEQMINHQGNVFIKINNYNGRYAQCRIKDEYTFHSFSVAPQSASMWYPVYGYYEWSCQ